MSAERGEREPAGVSWRVLVIEDNPADVHLIREALTQKRVRCELKAIDDGELAMEHVDAIEAGQQAAPDIVLLDLNLPRVSGDTLLERMRQSGAMANVPVLVLTSSDSPRDRRLAERLGATGYIHKPSNLDEFMEIGDQVRRVLAVRD